MKISKEKPLTIVIPVILIVLIVAVLSVNLFGGVKQTKTSITHEAGRELKLNVADFFKVNEETAGNITLDTSQVDVKKPGSYEVTATYKMHEYKITVDVQDTTAPAVELKHRYVFTNDITKLDETMYVDSVYDASEYTVGLVRFEKSENLKVLDEKALKSLTEAIVLPCNQETLKVLGTNSVPTEEGIYRAVLSAVDTYGNEQLEELYVILDKTGPKIEEVPDKEITVSKEQLTAAPEVNPNEYTVTDNVDGKAAADDIECITELKDETNHEWLVHVSHIDRAGNESTAEFLIVVKEESKPAENDKEQTPSEDDKNNQEDNQSDNKPENDKDTENGKPEDNNTSENDKTPEDDKSSEDNKTSEDDSNSEDDKNVEPDEKETQEQTPDNTEDTSDKNENNQTDNDTKFDPADTNKDGVVDTDEGLRYITPEKQACIDAGYGNVVELEPGKKYAVLMRSNDDMINGMYGTQIMRKYLFEHNLDGHISGAWIRSDEEWYWYMASNCYVSYQNPDTPEYWEENPWYDDEETGLSYFSYEDWINKVNGIPYK